MTVLHASIQSDIEVEKIDAISLSGQFTLQNSLYVMLLKLDWKVRPLVSGQPVLGTSTASGSWFDELVVFVGGDGVADGVVDGHALTLFSRLLPSIPFPMNPPASPAITAIKMEKSSRAGQRVQRLRVGGGGGGGGREVWW